MTDIRGTGPTGKPTGKPTSVTGEAGASSEGGVDQAENRFGLTVAVALIMGSIIGQGAVMNVASLAAYGPMAYTATYAATKAFVLSFSESVAAELAGTSVHIVCVCPGFTRTEFQERAEIDTSRLPGFVWMSSEQVADQAVRAVGRSSVVVNGAMNSLTSVLMKLAPRRLIARTGVVFRP